MLPGIGASELIVIAVVALIVVGPKDLPKMLRQLGRFVGKMRAMADEFRTSFEDMARQSELDDLRKEVEALRSGKSLSPIIDDIDSEMKSVQADIDNTIRSPSRALSSEAYGADVPSPDAADAEHLETLTTADVPENPAPKPRRTKKAVETAAADVAPKPRKPRAKKVTQKVTSE
ncbi:Sec-independent protein translocase protein TatB [Asticcacaulis endophyticus]|uniref:Sec-independent protein translocase protein TatB n=1 Tax=Asticcacaulis endophyticus TaxID=1395890 RepID=A0A918Q7V8_9CAUL|nr:Sec-independent protein translocase protein TatB [Asticcacaulis endophyticus]GGZ36639.1 Sec-independent protein translocase protein TatB [Asticcacaulis endophyticus]